MQPCDPTQGKGGVLAVVGLIYVGTLGLMWVLNYFQVLLTAAIGQASLWQLRNDMFAKLQRLSLSYFSRHPLGAVMSRITNDVDVISEFVTLGVTSLVGDVVMLLIIVGMMFGLDWRLALVSLAVMPLMWLASRVFSNRARTAFRQVRSTVGNVYGNLQESIDGVRTAQSFVREDRNAAAFERTNRQNVDASVRAGAIVSAFIPVVDTISALATALVIVVGGMFVINGEMGVGTLVAFIALIARFFTPIQQLTRFYNQLQSTMAAGEKIFELIDEPLDVEDQSDAQALPQIQGRVEFDGVTFGYNGTDVLHDISFDVAPGQRVALVGPTGARQDHDGKPAGPVSTRPAAARSASTVCRWTRLRRTRCGVRWASCRRTAICSRARFARTSRSRGRTPPTKRSCKRRRPWERTSSLNGRRRATTRTCANGERGCQSDNGSSSASRGRCWRTRAC